MNPALNHCVRALPLALLCASLGGSMPASAATSPPSYKVCPIGRACKWVPMPAQAVGRVTTIIPDNAIAGVTSSWIGKSATVRGERQHRCYNAVDWAGKSKSVCTMIHYTRGLAGYTIETKKADDGTLLYLFRRPAYSLANPNEMRYVGQYMYGLIAATRQLELLAAKQVNFAGTAARALKAKPRFGASFTTEGGGDDGDNNGGIGNTPGNGWGTFSWDDFGNVYASTEGSSVWDGYDRGAYEVPVEPIPSADWDSGYPNMPDETAPIEHDFPDFVSDDAVLGRMSDAPKQTGFFCSPPPLPVCIVTGTGVTAPFPSKAAIDKLSELWDQFRRDTGAFPDDDGDSAGRDARRAACLAAWKEAKKKCDEEATDTGNAGPVTDAMKLQMCYAEARNTFATCIGLNK